MFKRHSTTLLNRVRVPLLLLVGAVALLALPSGASAATTIGHTFDPSVGGFCEEEGRTFLQSTSPATTSYTAPTDGVITRWSFRAPATGVDKLKFKVARPAGGDFFTMIGVSALVDPAPDTLNSFFIQIPVKAGDVIGFHWDDANTAKCSRADGDYGYHFDNDDVVPPTTEEFFLSASNTQFDVSALLEPDCDNDGLGDETQDGNLSSCGAGVTLPTCRGERLTIVGTPGSDEIVGTAGVDVIAALGGNDKVFALGGNDLVCGNSGNDAIRGGPGNDILKGNRGNDTLRGKRGNDTLRGGKGNDTCRGGKGDDTEKSC